MSPKAHWLAFACPTCGVRLRIRAAYGHLRGRCPECRTRIMPLRRQPAGPRTTDEADLRPVEQDEWPEPAEVIKPKQEVGYGVGPPARGERPPVVDKPPQAAEGKRASRPAPTPARDDDEELEKKPKKRKRPATAPPPGSKERRMADILRYDTESIVSEHETPPPPEWPLLKGIYTFPFRPVNLVILAFMTFGFTVVGTLYVMMSSAS